MGHNKQDILYDLRRKQCTAAGTFAVYHQQNDDITTWCAVFISR